MTNIKLVLTRSVQAAMFALALAGFATAAAAQAKTDIKATPGATAAAHELIKITGATALFDPLIAGVVEQAKNLYLQQNPALGKDLNEIAAKLRTDLAPRYAELTDEISRIYATQFTEQELKDIIAFYQSPVGKKMLNLQPQVVDSSMKFAQDWAIKLSDEVTHQMREELKKKGHPM